MAISFATVFRLLPAFLQRPKKEEDSVLKKSNMELISIKLLLVICPEKEKDSIRKEEEDSKNSVRRFFNSGVSQEQLTQIVDCSRKLTIVLKAECKMYKDKAHLVNSVSS